MNNEQMQKIKQRYSKRQLTRARAIKLYCRELCACGDLRSWKECSFYNCFLWQFRLGRELKGNQTSFPNKSIKKQSAKPILLAKTKHSSRGYEPNSAPILQNRVIEHLERQEAKNGTF